MNFSDALNAMKAHCRMTRRGWNGKGMYVGVYEPINIADGMSRPYLYMRTVDGKNVPWVASQTDLMADDWDRAVDSPPAPPPVRLNQYRETSVYANPVTGALYQDTGSNLCCINSALPSLPVTEKYRLKRLYREA